MLDKYYKNAIEDAINSLLDDGVIIVPTDTVYGLATLANSKLGIERIYQIKKRDKDKLLPVVVNSYKMLKMVSDIDLKYVKKLNKFFPGPLTIVVKRNPNFTYFNANTIAIRMIDSPLINTLINKVNYPLALTSANVSNTSISDDPLNLLEIFDGAVDCIFLDKKVSNKPSTIVEITTNGQLKLIREGILPFSKVLKEYNGND